MSRLAVDIDTARKNLNSHDWVAVDMYDSLCKKCNGSILNVTLVFNCVAMSSTSPAWLTLGRALPTIRRNTSGK